MRIDSLKLTNVKSYGAEGVEIKFGSGLNLIKGQNGAGKSTILEAIGYALFDNAIYKHDDFVRKGEASGQITVTLADSDDKQYEVVRGVKNSQFYIYDSVLKLKLAQGKADVLDWLHAHMSIDTQTDLSSLFNDAVGVPQGTMTAIFLETPGDREKKFNKLLRFEDYKIASDNLRSTEKFVEGLQHENDIEQSKNAGKLERLPTVQSEITTLIELLTQDREAETLGNERLASLHSRLDTLEQLKRQIEDADDEIRQLQGALDILIEKLGRANNDVAESLHAAEQISALQPAYEGYKQAERALVELEDARKKRDNLSRQRADAQTNLVASQTAINGFDETLSDVEQAEKDIATLTPQANHQRQLTQELEAAKADYKKYTELDDQIKAKRRDLAKFERILSDLSRDLERRNDIVQAINSLQAQRDQTASQLSDLEAQREPLASQKSRLESDLNQQHVRDSQRQSMQKQIDDTQAELARQKARLETLQAEVARRQELQASIDNLQAQQESLKRNEANAIASNERIKEQRTQIAEYRNLLSSAEIICPVCQQPLDADAQTHSLSHYDAEEKRIEEDYRHNQDVIDHAKSELKQIDKDLKALQKDLKLLASEVQLDYQKAEIERYTAPLSTLQSELSVLDDAPASIQQLENELGGLLQQITDLDVEKEQLTSSQRKFSADIENLQVEISKLARPEEHDSKQGDYHKLADDIEKAQSDMDSLFNSAAQVDKLQATIQALGDPAQSLNKAQVIAMQRSATEQKKSEQRRRLEEAERQIHELDQQMEPFSTVDSNVAQAHKQLESYKDSYADYQSYKPQAEKLEQVEQHAIQLQRNHEELTIQLGPKRQQRAAMAQRYDEDEYQQLHKEEITVKGEIGKIQGRIVTNQENFDARAEELENLQEVQAQQEDLEDKANMLRERATAIEFVRNTIKEAGPLMTRRIAQLVGAEASRIFGDIIGDHSMTLEWREDYGIGVIAHGTTRDFRLLSGGEQMAAAISIRLAILTHLSEIRFAFFDEPTVNLDETRRIQLAQRLNQIRNLEQVFIISHDDTFEENCQHIVLIEKTDDLSHVVPMTAI